MNDVEIVKINPFEEKQNILGSDQDWDIARACRHFDGLTSTGFGCQSTTCSRNNRSSYNLLEGLMNTKCCNAAFNILGNPMTKIPARW